MSERTVHNFGVVDDTGDLFEFHWEADKGGRCRLEAIVQTERGPRRSELALIPAVVWNDVSSRVVRELAAGMGENERLKKAPTLKNGTNRLSPFIGRELAVLLWALMEVADDGNIEAILHGWRELAREERWWLYTKGAAPGQRTGAGWRRALFHALSETSDSRAAEPVPQEKKSPGIGSRSGRKASPRKKAGAKQPAKSKSAQELPMASGGRKSSSRPSANLNKKEAERPPEKRTKREAGKEAAR